MSTCICRMLCVLRDLWRWHPPVGVWIGVLGLLGVLVPLIREKIGKREKAVWTLAMFVLLGLEIKSVYQDRNEHDAQQADARKRETESFENIANGINGAINKSDQHFQATMESMQQTFQAAESARKNTESRASLEFDVMTPYLVNGVRPKVEPGMKIPVNVHFLNNGGKDAQNPINYALLYVRKPEDSKAEQEIASDFEKKFADAVKNKNFGRQAPIKGHILTFFSFDSKPLTEDEVNAVFHDRTEVFYLLVTLQWEDHTGTWAEQECLWYQNGAKEDYPLRVAHPCLTHRRSRFRIR